MGIQATYHNTGLTIDDAIERAEKSGMFEVRQAARDDCVHVMLYPKQHPGVKIQVLRCSANVWFQDLDQLHEIEGLLNKTLADRSKPKPFKKPKIQLHRGELPKILETPLGLISFFSYYHASEIADVIYQVIMNMDNWYKGVFKQELKT